MNSIPAFSSHVNPTAGTFDTVWYVKPLMVPIAPSLTPYTVIIPYNEKCVFPDQAGKSLGEVLAHR
jgi:hypothetical protein